MQSKRATITDVARLAGVSKATVSAVLNDTGTVKASTRDRVLSVMENVNYRPAGFSGRAAAQNERSIGLVIKEIDNPYYGEVVTGARAAAQESGYTLLVTSSEGEYEAERKAVELLQRKEVDGLILTPVLDYDADLSHLFELKRRNFPFVLLEELRGVPAGLIDVDNEEASRKAVEFLIAQGHTRIVHFAGPAYSWHSQERVDGVRRACSASHVIFGDDDVVRAGAHMEDGYRAGLEYFGALSPAGRPTAVTCYNDLVALGLCRALGELGIGVPTDVSVVGFDDIQMLEYLPLRLTTVRMPKFEMGQLAAQMLIRHIESRETLPPQKVHLEAELVVRDSTRAVSQPAPRGRIRLAAADGGGTAAAGGRARSVATP
ncbi:MAG TPA: LacI family DNA-binding transcriptional regulator [Longimicrobium sp.]|jgi:DNA-binding LacI/PurR family transcriptional regulator|uniref:LacI family DNA-binding transcriptional regulator n=1 Tax=Longimicrobium sp. TaxID=2029185 RepID=UPI002EDB5788